MTGPSTSSDERRITEVIESVYRVPADVLPLLAERLAWYVSEARAGERERIKAIVAAIDPNEHGIPRYEEDDVPSGWQLALNRVEIEIGGSS